MILSNKQKGTSLAFFGALMITPDSLFIRLININSWDLIFYRGLIPFICLFFVLIIIYKKNFVNLCLAIGLAGILNAILVALGNVTFIVSIENTNVANTLIMISLAPFAAAIMSSLFIGERPNKRTWLTIITCFAFVLFIFYDSYESKRIIGDFFGLLTAFFIAGSAVVIRYNKSINFLPSLLLSKLLTIFIAIFLVNNLNISGSDFFLVIGMGILCVVIPLSLLTLAPRYIPAHEVELFMVLETALGPIWVWIVINEQPSIKTIIGGTFIIIIIFIYTLYEFREKKLKK